MSDSFVTQCPHCNTTFRVTEQHLGAAGGSVRCGSCLKIFSAKDHLLQRASQVPPATAVPSKPKPAQQPTFSEEDIAGASDHFSAKSDDDDLVFEDDPLFDDYDSLEQFDDTPASEPAPQKPEYDEDSYNFGELSEEISTVRTDVRAQQAHSDAPPAEHLVDDQWDELDDSLFKQPERPQLNTASTPDSEQFTADSLSIFSNDPDAVEFSGNKKHQGSAERRNTDMVDNIDADPLELHFDNKAVKRRQWLWTSGSILLLLAAMAQLAWFGIEPLGRNPTFRPWYERLCEVADCELPQMVDAQQFRTGNLILRKDLRRPGNLIVDAILINQAPFDQPFPQIILEFKNLTGVIVADGSFSPAQYLNGEMTGEHNMPSKTPIHISFSVVSPGDDAVNYSLRYQ